MEDSPPILTDIAANLIITNPLRGLEPRFISLSEGIKNTLRSIRSNPKSGNDASVTDPLPETIGIAMMDPVTGSDLKTNDKNR